MAICAAWYCHDFTPSAKKEDRTDFSLILEGVNSFLFDAGLHPAFGILDKDGKEVDMTPDEFVESICVDGVLPRRVRKLLPYCFDGGGEMCGIEFKRHICEFVKAMLHRVPWTHEKALKNAKKLYKKDKLKPK